MQDPTTHETAKFQESPSLQTSQDNQHRRSLSNAEDAAESSSLEVLQTMQEHVTYKTLLEQTMEEDSSEDWLPDKEVDSS